MPYYFVSFFLFIIFACRLRMLKVIKFPCFPIPEFPKYIQEENLRKFCSPEYGRSFLDIHNYTYMDWSDRLKEGGANTPSDSDEPDEQGWTYMQPEKTGNYITIGIYLAIKFLKEKMYS